MITIIDYGCGNLDSIRNMLKKCGHDSEITGEASRVATAGKLLLPGVGAFDAGMENLDRSGLIPLLSRRVLEDRVPVLGICLGMQLMTRRSEEGERPGLGWVDAEVVRLRPASPSMKVPHMGWNIVHTARAAELTDGLPTESRFYFVHSYRVQCVRDEDVLLRTSYGIDFHSGFHRDNVWGVQFHPEKSHRFGLQLLRNFAERC